MTTTLTRNEKQADSIIDMDCSEHALSMVVREKYGRFPVELHRDTEFNRWGLYEFLKQYCGVKEYYFARDEYEKRMAVIKKLAGV